MVNCNFRKEANFVHTEWSYRTGRSQGIRKVIRVPVCMLKGGLDYISTSDRQCDEENCIFFRKEKI
jgi:hypothetical protein